MKVEEFDKLLQEKHGGKYGIMPPPTSDKEALQILTKHFLGDYYSVNPINGEQFNTEVIFRILEKYPTDSKEKSWFERIFSK